MQKENLSLSPDYSNTQLTFLVLLRMLIGWHFLYEGLVKVLNPYWSSVSYLVDSQGIFSGMFTWITNNPEMLTIADLLNKWGLVAIGLGLLLGLFSRISSGAGILLLLLYYLAQPPFPGLKFTNPSEGSYLIVNKNLIELFALFVLTVFPTGKRIGLDRFIMLKRKKKLLV